jgi:hypothetical protein
MKATKNIEESEHLHASIYIYIYLFIKITKIASLSESNVDSYALITM